MADAFYTPVALHLSVDLDRHSDLREPIESVLCVPLAAANRLSGVDPLILWQGQHDWLILCDKADANALQENLAKAVEDKPVLITQAGDGLAAFTFTDPDAATQLSSGTGLDLCPKTFPVGASAITRFAQLRAIIYRQTDRYTLIVERQYTRHVELWLARPRY
jgi:heterotetrameric sarcosine oxidase gamma subunit